MRGLSSLYRSSVGKKILMAVTGVVLIFFVVVHMLGNLKVFLGRAHFNEYAHWLRTVGEPAVPHGGLLWIFRIVLLASVAMHMLFAWQTYRMSRSARGESYEKSNSLEFSYASKTMRWGGLAILVFVVYHVMHLTLGMGGTPFDPASPFDNLVAGFRVWPVSVFYVLAMVPLGLHLYHGIWSACQTLDINNPRIRDLRRPFSAAVALAIVVGNCSIPLSVLAGWVG
jgi:succinate dehydrogenase / fumarate reductase cytochrome b subunit